MKIILQESSGLMLLEPQVFGDDRGFFLESYNQKIFSNITNTNYHFVQDNHSKSIKHVLRGLHHQKNNPQGKLVRVIQGEIFDVAVDIRKDSPHFGQWKGHHLSSKNKQTFWIPPGFAHGFLVLSDLAEIMYKTTHFYDPQSEIILQWNDPSINIKWPLGKEKPILSKKDQQGLSFKKIKELL